MTSQKQKGFQKRLIPIKKGTKFGKLTTISDSPIRSCTTSPNTGKNTFRAKWECICDCGNTRLVTGTRLRDGSYTSCSSCAYKSRAQFKNRFTPAKRIFRLSVVNRCKNSNGRIRNELTLEQFEQIIAKNCHYCGAPPSEITYFTKNKIVENRKYIASGVDRIDSHGHYTLNNSVPCCKICNTMKMALSVTEFYSHIKKILNFKPQFDDR